jgi:TetR/AcrR family transcriptional regulator, mexJK operon transcriptional repressor
MPPRDTNEFEERRQQIIDGALAVFADKGFEKATNKDIAEAAGINSPGLIYHYFKDKTDLFFQVLEQRAPVLQLLRNADELMERPPREVLTRFTIGFMRTLSLPGASQLYKLILGEAIRQPEVAAIVNRVGPTRGLSFLTRYLERQMELGVIRRMDPGAAARCFIGPMVVYVLTREVFVQPDSPTLSVETMAETLVEIYLGGALVTPPCP